MNRSNAHGLAGGGALLTAFSLVTPWYVLEAGNATGLGKMGAQALGGFALLVLALAVAAGWSLTARVHPWAPPLAATALALVVLAKIVSPPGAAGVLAGAQADDPLQAQHTGSFGDALANGLGLHYAPTWGIWLAAMGAGATLAGTIAALRHA